MPQPYFTISISASAVAWYAAILSTVGTLIQTANYLRDKLRVKVRVHKNMKIFNDPSRDGTIFTEVIVINAGRRPFTLTNIGLLYLQNRASVFMDTTPRTPCELTEGKQAVALVPQDGIYFGNLRCFVAYDALGRQFRKNIAPWHKRMLWTARARLNPKAYWATEPPPKTSKSA
jgi:hypothetical protein